MKKELLRWALCFLFFPALHATAQDTKPAPAPAQPPAPATAPSIDAAPATAPATISEKEKAVALQQAAPAPTPVFADSLMRNYEIEVFQNVLKMADLASVKYMDVLAKAKTGDVTSMHQLLDFHRVVDGVDALNHAVTCLELIPVVGDAPFAAAVYRCPPKLKKLVLERLMLAQVRTKKTFLRQSLTNWAPMTWAYLNGQPIVTSPQQPVEGTTLQPAGQTPEPAASPVNTNPVLPTRKQ